MIGLAAACGRDAGTAVGAMLEAFDSAHSVVIRPFDGAAIALARVASGFATDVVDGGTGGLSVLFVGEVFDEAVAANPAEAIHRLYREDALSALAGWNGAFSAVIADPNRQAVILATDRVGHRPFFVWADGDGFAAATRLPALLGDRRVPRRLSTQGVIELVSFQRTFGTHTQYADIRSMPAASLWRYADGRLERSRSRKLSWRRPDFGEAEAVDLLADAFGNAVERRLRAPGRAGLLFSGGLDARSILGAGVGRGVTVPCITATACDNRETRIARQATALVDAPQQLIENRPSMLAERLDAATLASDGLFAAPLNMFGMWPQLAGEFDAMLSGHAFDYMFRGYYLPCRAISPGRSVTRLPMLLPVPDGTPATVARMQRVGIPMAETGSVLSDAAASALARRREVAIAHALEGCELQEPHDAWDGFIMHTLGRHYAYSDFVAMETVLVHRAPALDHEVLDLFLALPPRWRASGRIARAAMRRLAPELMRLPDANTGLPADWSFWLQMLAGYGVAAVGRLRLRSRPGYPEPSMTEGSWADYNSLMRTDPAFRALLLQLPASPALGDSGIFDMRRVASLVEGHLEGRRNVKRTILQLLTLDAWLRAFGHTATIDD